jgi:hypothetical protein
MTVREIKDKYDEALREAYFAELTECMDGELDKRASAVSKTDGAL